MTKNIDISSSKKFLLPAISDEEANKESGKGWSFSNVYSFRELRDVFLIVRDSDSIEEIYAKVAKLVKPAGRDWSKRRILEQLNALKNFNLIDKNYAIIDNFFPESVLGSRLQPIEEEVFKNIFFSYFRFKEIMSWFIDPMNIERSEILDLISPEFIELNTKPAFTLQMNGRFNDTFLFELVNGTNIFLIPPKMEHLMRFWDVFIKWGTELKLLEKFNLRDLDIKIVQSQRSLSCVYFINSHIGEIDLYKFIKSEYKSYYIDIPKLVFKIAVRFRMPIELIKRIIIKEAEKNYQLMSLQRTSEIFIRGKEEILYPKYKDAYISHILLL